MPPEAIIRSRHNPIYKQVRSLLRRDRRHQERAFLVEGPRFIQDARQFGAIPQLLVLSESLADRLELAPDAFRSARIFDDELYASISDTVTSQGMIGVFPFPELHSPADIAPFLLVADGVQDPGNLGTLIRSAAGAGATKVVVLPGTTDPWAPKTVRAAASAHFMIPIEHITSDAFADALTDNIAIVGADASAATRYDEIDFSGPVALIVGGEGSGISDRTRMLIDEFVSIPLSNDVESINAGVAGSILLFEAARQRRNSVNSGEKANV